MICGGSVLSEQLHTWVTLYNKVILVNALSDMNNIVFHHVLILVDVS